jgi:hypothetical protein
MTYHERELSVSRSSQSQQPYSQKRTFNNSQYPSHRLPPQSLRIECKTEERHFITDISPYTINTSVKPIRLTMNDQIKPMKFRSEIIVHNNPETDLQIKRLRVAFHYHDEPTTDPIFDQHSSYIRTQSLHRPPQRQQLKHNDSKTTVRPVEASKSQSVLHKWIDDICTNEQLMDTNDIVFFIKNGEFFARI